jgi:hypothetical protein
MTPVRVRYPVFDPAHHRLQIVEDEALDSSSAAAPHVALHRDRHALRESDSAVTTAAAAERTQSHASANEHTSHVPLAEGPRATQTEQTSAPRCTLP